MTTEDIVQKLMNVEFFRGFPQEVLSYLASKMELKSYSKDEVLSKEGEYDPRLFLLDTGFVNATKQVRSDSHVLIRVISPGDIMGLTSVFQDQGIRSTTLTAAEDSSVWTLNYNDFQKLIEGETDYNPKKIVNSILSYVTKKLRSKNHQIADILSKDIDTRLRIAVFDSKDYFVENLTAQNKNDYGLSFFKEKLSAKTVQLAFGHQVVCAFVNDTIDRDVVYKLKEQGVELIAMLCAGYNNVDLAACKEVGITVVRVPAYSPNAVSEHTVALLMALNRKVHRAYNRVREGNFALSGLVGFDLYKKKVGVIGTGKIGEEFIKAMLGFGCRVLAYDKFQKDVFRDNPNFEYVDLDEIFSQSDIVSLHVPLLEDTKHIINRHAIEQMKEGVILINTSRGELIDSKALIEGLKSKKIGGAGLDVYEDEKDYFFEDHSSNIINDDIFARLMSFNNVIVTSHQAFLTKEALTNITETTFENIENFLLGLRGQKLPNCLTV